MTRVELMWRAWYRPQYKMGREEWQYIGLLALVCLYAWGLGLLIGWIWVLAL